MSTMPVFYMTVPQSGTFTFPEELRGKPLKIVVEEEPVTPFGNHETGILSIAGILKNGRDDDVHDERYEYLMEKYAHARDTD